MKAPLLAYQSSHKSFVPSVEAAPRNVVDTLTTDCEHRLAPCQVTHHVTPDANPTVHHPKKSQRDSFLKRLSFTNRMHIPDSSENSHASDRCPHNLVEAQMGMSSRAFHVEDNAPKARRQSWRRNLLTNQLH